MRRTDILMRGLLVFSGYKDKESTTENERIGRFNADF